jgi:phosphatidylinositol alpha-mannosyltransferase
VALVSPYALSVPGGVQEQVLAMSRELSARGDEVLVLAPDHRDRGPHDTPARVLCLGPLASVPANGSRAPLTLSPGAARRARDAMADFAPSVVHLHEPFAPVLGYAVLHSRRWPSVGTFHRSGGGPAYRFTGALLRPLGRGLDVVAAVSDSAAATVSRGAGLSAEVLYNGFELARFREFPRVVNPEPVVLFVGRLEERKGAVTLVEAALAQTGERPWRGVLLGDGPQRAALEDAAAGSDRVAFLGAVDDATKRRWLRRADVCVAASTHGESFGLVILEAMASETPVVVSDIPGYREAAGGFARLFAPGDAVSLAAAIDAALGAKDRPEIDAARAHAERWSMAGLMDRYEELYERARRRHGAER